MVDEGHRPSATEGISDGVISTAIIFEHISRAVLKLNLVAVAITLRHLLEQTGAIEHPPSTLAEAAVARVGCLLSIATAGAGVAGTVIAASEELFGQTSCHILFSPAVIPAGALLDAAGLAGAEPEVVAAGTAQIGGEAIGGELAEVDLRDPDRGAVAVIAGLAHLVAHHTGLGVSDSLALGGGGDACQGCADQCRGGEQVGVGVRQEVAHSQMIVSV